MVLTPSTMLPLGAQAPDFSLTDVASGKVVSRSDFSGRKALLVMFICRHCPYVKHIGTELSRLGRDYKPRGLGLVAVSSNDTVSYPDDSPPALKEMAVDLGLIFPVCFDETQEIAKAYHASCTPDFFLFDRDGSLVYRGQFDDSRPGNGRPVTGRDLRTAIDAVLTGGWISPDQKPSIGCNIKWKPGNEPRYFLKT